jgi:NDP-sugar pyrophosphorylase family protein
VLHWRPGHPDPGRIAGVVPVIATPLAGGIIAAGDGRRLRADGFLAPKPLVAISGVPLIERMLCNLFAAGVIRTVVVVNEEAQSCVDWVRERFRDAEIEFIVKTTQSSLESFLEVSRRLPAGRAVISTVDAWCPPEVFVQFVRGALRRPAGASVLAVTPLVADEKPLWVNVDEDGRVTNLGGAPAALVTAGIYMLSERARRALPPPLPRLRDFLGWLLREGEPVYAELIPAVVDVDRASDVALAEALEARRSNHSREGGKY